MELLPGWGNALPCAVAGLIIYIAVQFMKKLTKNSPGKPNHVFSSDESEIIIIGSGVLGSAMGTVLARDGRRVTIIERDLKEPDRIIGELLQPGGLQALKKLGLGDCVEGFDAHEMKGYIIHDTETGSKVHIPYPKDGDNSTFAGCAFHHGKFVMALRNAAKQEKNVTYIEGSASKLIEDKGIVIGVQYREKDSEKPKEVFAPLTIVADGCFSKFRKNLVGENVTITSYFVGTLMKHCPQIKDNHAELVLMEPSPVLIYQISSEQTRILVDIKGGMPKDIKGYLLDEVAPNLPEHVIEPFKDAVVNDRVRSMPNSFLPASPLERPGALVLGDAMNMRHPLTGGGMSVVFNDAIILKDLMKTVTDLSDYDQMSKTVQQFHWKRKNSHSFVVNILAQALYELFAAKDEYLYRLKRACFAYFKLGGKCVDGPVGLLSVMNPKPHVLIGHFFAVALYAVFFVFKTEPWWAIHRVVFLSSMIFIRACGVILPLIWMECRHLIV